LLGLPQRTGGQPPHVVPPRGQLAALASSQPLRLACAANLLFSPIFNAVVVALVPLRGEALGFSAVAIGALFTIRALVSTSTRLPTGVISTPAWSYRLVLLALALGGAAALALSEARSYPLFAAALAAEGLSYGVFLTAGQAFVAQRVERGSLGAALGAYSTAGGISGVLSPFLLGLLADRMGIPAALWLAGAMALLGAAALALRLGHGSLKVFRQV
jgi:MFS family permease